MPRRRLFDFWTVISAFLLAVCLFAGLGAIGLVGPDEPRYASIARAMARTGDWVTPRLWGHPWFEKPILSYWAAAVSFRLVGVSALAARLPSAFAALLGALLLAWAASRLYGKTAARLLLALFPTTLGLFAFAHAATMDMLLAVSLEAAMVSALCALRWFEPGSDPKIPPSEVGASAPTKTPAERWVLAPEGVPPLRPERLSHQENSPAIARFSLALTGACVGLGTLAKGPVAIVLAGGSVVLWAIVTRRWRDALRFLRWEPLSAFAVVALPWYIACSLANPGFAYFFLWYQNVTRFLTPVFEHMQPWWFFIPVLALGLLPWTPVLLVAARDGWRLYRSGSAASSPSTLVACWAAFPLLFFSFSESKLPGYILPALPPLVLLLARAIDRIAVPGTRDRDRLAEWAIALVGLAWIALALTANHWLSRLPVAWVSAHHGAILGFLGATGALGACVAALALLGRPRHAVAGAALWMGVLVATASWYFLPQVDPYISARAAARAARPIVAAGSVVEVYGLNRDWAYGLNYYFGRELPEWSPSQPGTAWVFTKPKTIPVIERNPLLIQASAFPLPGGLALVRISRARR